MTRGTRFWLTLAFLAATWSGGKTFVLAQAGDIDGSILAFCVSIVTSAFFVSSLIDELQRRPS